MNKKASEEIKERGEGCLSERESEGSKGGEGEGDLGSVATGGRGKRGRERAVFRREAKGVKAVLFESNAGVAVGRSFPSETDS